MEIERQTIEFFESRFGRPAAWAAQAPGRVNLIGEHTDYNQGFVLPIAIDRRTVVAAAPSEREVSTLVAVNLDREVEIDLTRPLQPIPRDDPGAFANYLLGVIHEFSDRGAGPINLDLAVISDVPIGAGLSSSASVEVAMATLLEQALAVALAPVEKALLCQRAEHAFPGTPCGIMDMYIAAAAVADHALLIDCRSNDAQAVRLPPAHELTLLVVDTGAKHDLAAGAYAERRVTCERAASKLGVGSLRDATPSMLADASLDEVERKRATHVVLENVRTLLAASALEAGQPDEFCRRLFESHASLRDLYEVSCPELDAVVDAVETLAKRTGDPLLGARMTGGGFGGCAVVCCPPAIPDRVAEVIAGHFRDAFGREPMIMPARACRGSSNVQI